MSERERSFEIPDDAHGYARMYGYHKSAFVADVLRESYENEGSKYWDRFYKSNTNHFFKDRHWIDREFPEVSQGSKLVLEVGCGVGNALFPLQKSYHSLRFYSFDYSQVAIKLLQENPQYDRSRTVSFVHDISTEDSFPANVPVGSFDLCLLLFVLSAVPPHRMAHVVTQLYAAMKPGGVVMFRDYAQDDMAQHRFSYTETSYAPKTVSDNYHIRKDGTAAYFFDIDHVTSLFQGGGFTVLENRLIQKDIVNRKESKSMNRIFIQGKFIK